MKATKPGFIIAIAFLFSISPVMAQDNGYERQGWTGGLGLSQFTLDEMAAAEERIDESAFSLDLFASYYFSSRMVATLGASLLRFDDNAEFSQQVLVTDIFGTEVETATSEASGFQLAAQIEYMTPPLSTLEIQFRGGAGFAAIAGADRSIDNCTDCREEDLDIEGGPFFTASIFKSFSDSFTLGLGGRQYASGDVKSTATFWFEYNR